MVIHGNTDGGAQEERSISVRFKNRLIRIVTSEILDLPHTGLRIKLVGDGLPGRGHSSPSDRGLDRQAVPLLDLVVTLSPGFRPEDVTCCRTNDELDHG